MFSKLKKRIQGGICLFLKSDILSLRKTELRDLDFVCGLESNVENAKFIIPWPKKSMKRRQWKTLMYCTANGMNQ